MSRKDEYLKMAGNAATVFDGLSQLYDWLGGTPAAPAPTLSDQVPETATRLRATVGSNTATDATFDIPVGDRTVPVFVVQADERVHFRWRAVPFDPNSGVSTYLLHRNHQLLDLSWEVTEEWHRFVADCRGSQPRKDLTATELAPVLFALAREFDATVNGCHPRPAARSRAAGPLFGGSVMLRIRLLTAAYCAVALTLNPADAEGIVVAGITGIVVVPLALNRVARNIAAEYEKTAALPGGWTRRGDGKNGRTDAARRNRRPSAVGHPKRAGTTAALASLNPGGPVMDPFEFCLVVMVAAAASLAWGELKKMRREDALHDVRFQRELLECRKLEQEIEKSARV